MAMNASAGLDLPGIALEILVCNAGVYGTMYQTYKDLYKRLRGLYREVNEVRFRK
jgi:hypothetical protein